MHLHTYMHFYIEHFLSFAGFPFATAGLRAGGYPVIPNQFG